jgi:hypothetical protein
LGVGVKLHCDETRVKHVREGVEQAKFHARRKRRLPPRAAYVLTRPWIIVANRSNEPQHERCQSIVPLPLHPSGVHDASEPAMAVPAVQRTKGE